MEFIVGIFVGALLYYVFCERKKISGKLTVDLTTNAAQPVSINFYESLEEIYFKKHITLSVEVLEDDSLN